ncbi:S1 RNA-binding domain-containing protein [Streptomyces sp. 4R-3d]|uniref:S1 RNA-binding domain-containing protein n=1 Tax=Streptomyces sp. 4R-3d TaxID=2559605 RepID=UPI0032AF70C7
MGQTLRGRVTKLIEFGVFVEVADGVEGLVHRDELAREVAEAGAEMTVVVTDVDRERRRLLLSERRAAPDAG